MRRRLAGMVAADALATSMICGLCAAAPQDTKVKIAFVQNGIGVSPADFEFWRTGAGAVGDWAVVRDSTSSVGAAIEQSSGDHAENRYPLAIYKPLALKNVEVSTSFKLVSGTAPTAGIAVRLVNAGSYYVVAANALEGRVDLFRFVDGRRERIAGTEGEVVRNHWQMLRVAVEDDHVTVSLDEQLLFKAWDRTFLKDGRVALWTEEDTVARFDRLEIARLPWSEHD